MGQRDEDAVAEGKHLSARPPLGYLRKDAASPRYDDKGVLVRDARLVLDPKTADAVRKAFVMRADGASYDKISDFLLERTGRRVVKSSLHSIFRNPAYLGQARGPRGATKADAHNALVDADLFARVQPLKRGGLPAKSGSAERTSLLGSLIRCAGCGHLLRVQWYIAQGRAAAAVRLRPAHQRGRLPGARVGCGAPGR